MNFKTIACGIALTCGAFALSSTLNVSPAQAVSINGILNVAGSGYFANGPEKTPAATDTIKFSTPGTKPIVDSKVTASSTGFFASYTGQIVSISDIDLTLNGTPTTTATGSIANYIGSATNPFIKFSDGLIFDIQNPLNVIKTSLTSTSTKSAYGVLPSFTGYFRKGDSVLGEGLLTVNQIKQNGSFSLTAEAVPEPLTILGSATALGLGAALKKKYAKKQNKEKAVA
ncbi:MAG: PEP-CTERM sorting domain-containing protein [Mojavia pulchra JT2-VF2]|jgi:hypothetical protein|uniref:PEP-CTERM sorting domain-containing protein n=1 Tax=Mojavia pulchra JT2-VF2 TaxID=287848 RepID=A0A951UGU3_9NOST|nr:PEP-CTERM sorting domain-containing protein [Mojavia pulchra JT2-VF2]